MKTNCGSSPDSLSNPFGFTNGNEKKSGFFDLSKQEKQCKHLDHEPPKHIYIPQGKGYRHVCPACGAETVMIPQQVTL